MTDEQFCKIESALTGEPIDKVEQLVSKTFTGRELKEYLEDAFALHSVSESFSEDCEDCEYVMYNDDTAICKKCDSCITVHKP